MLYGNAVKRSGLTPESREARFNLGMMLLETDQVDEGLRELREAMRLSPQWPLAMGTVAWVLATSPEARLRNAGEATELAEQAAVLTDHRDPLILDVLAASYAASGRFEEAVATARAAIDRAAAAGGSNDWPTVFASDCNSISRGGPIVNRRHALNPPGRDTVELSQDRIQRQTTYCDSTTARHNNSYRKPIWQCFVKRFWYSPRASARGLGSEGRAREKCGWISKGRSN